MSKRTLLDSKEVLQLLQPKGLLSRVLKGFEPRAQQQQMLSNVIDAYNKSSISLIEAGTGTGKSMAYLIPAILWAVLNKERTVISTNTITLQEQLIHKDIPALLKALNVEVKAVLVKGMSNYVCLRKLDEARHSLPFLSPDDRQEIERIDIWGQATTDGSKASLSFIPSSSVWESVCAEHDTCNQKKCPFLEQCHFFRARKQVQDAQILVVNHHLLFSDLASRELNDNYTEQAILPSYRHLILDEAHHIEDVATEYFATRTSHLGFIRTMGRLSNKLLILKNQLSELNKNALPTKFSTRLNIDLQAQREDCLLYAADAFDGFANFARTLNGNATKHETDENKFRLFSEHYSRPAWQQGVIPSCKRLIDSLLRYTQTLEGLEKDLESCQDERLQERTKGIRFEISALQVRLQAHSLMLEKIATKEPSKNAVRWIDLQRTRSMVNVHLVEAELEVSERLAKGLFSKFATTVLCSATLATNRKFDFIRQRLGLAESFPRSVTEHIYESPFDYEKQALLVIPTDIPNPSDPQFTQAATENIWQAIQSSRGNAFVLFTSYTMLKTCFELLRERLETNRFVSLKQGDDNRLSLLNRFRNTDRSVLFATDSFWEGVDVAGDALRCVILVKLPFRVPSEPIIQARTEAISAKGGDPFMEYSLPHAIVKFKQGFGRLIRNKNDRGCVVCLDSRLLTKKYGAQFLNSLPSCQKVFEVGKCLPEQMSTFYRKTHHLTKS